MPSYDNLSELPKKVKTIKSALNSESFDADGTIHVDGIVGSATIAPSGRDVALASPDGLAIIDLDSPYSPPRRLRSHGMPWLVVDVQWSPFAARDYWIVSTANHRALVWNLNSREESSAGAIEHSLQGHSRAITDVNWSAHHPDFLATCSVDGYIHSWDLRRPRQPVLTFCDWSSGASQVKFNRQASHILASAHDQFLHIWDERRTSEPLKTYKAHDSKIYGLDWNRTRSTVIASCSIDKTIKFWDYSDDGDRPEHVIHTGFPVWRARHTPFGEGLLAMPQNEPGDLYLYDVRRPQGSYISASIDPVVVFPGHGDHKAKEFLWRSRGGITDEGIDDREFQLVSWGADNELRLQGADAHVLSAVGHARGKRVTSVIPQTRKGATYKTFRTVDDSSNRERKAATMSDHRPGAPTSNYRQSALTIGMRSATNSNHRMGVAWRGPSMKAKVGRGKATDRNQSQIGWMKGITMTKRKSSSDASKRHPPKETGIFGHGYLDDEWGEPDTIQEELLRISTQLPKVKWENIDMDSLTLTASLHGPWGVEGETIFIKVRIDVPSSYPKGKAPKFLIEKTSFMPTQVHRKIEREIHELADQFVQRKQNCLEVAFTYLLGEVDLETSTTFFKNVRDLDDEIDAMADESSSESDEDIPAGGSASMSQELVPHNEIDTALAPPNRTIIPPPPRTCGARFSHNGRLVCFFPTKEEKARALFSTTLDAYRERPKGEPFFAGFGRIAHELGPRQRFMVGEDGSGSDGESGSDDSRSSSSSSSDSESTSMHKISLWYQPRHVFRKTWSEDRSIRSSGGGTGAGTGTGTGTSRRRPGRPRNLISIHDLRALLPSKEEFAKEYAIFGDGAEVCEHNAKVAEKYGAKDLVHVWRYLGLLLKRGIPLEFLGHNQRRESILVIAHEVVSKCSGDGSLDNVVETNGGLSGRVKWGGHPLAKGFIMDLFDYFEKMADIQMLAMLSCIFGDSSGEDSVAYFESHLTQPDTPLPFKAPSFSLDYFPTDASVWNIYSRSYSNSAATTPMTMHTPRYAGSQASDDGLWNGDPASNSYSCGETPPNKFKGYLGELEPPPSLSTSPNTRFVPRANSGLASAFAANLPRSFTAGSSSSPPGQGRKRPSPAETILSSLAPSMGNITWSASTAMDSSGGRTSLSDDEYRRDDFLPLVPINVSVTMEDQTIFDDDGWLSTPLLEPSRSELYANYRYAYAEMLQIWNQPLARLEIMKFNVLKEDAIGGHVDGSSTTLHDGASGNLPGHHPNSSPIAMGKRDQLQALLASGRGIDVTGVCRIHETQLEPLRYTTTNSTAGGAVGTCDRCHRMQSQLRCVYCLEPVDALFPPCLACGCASHEACLAEWHAAGETQCPAGDECNCAEEADDGQVESWAALQGAMLKGPRHLPMLPGPALGSDDESKVGSGWERVETNIPSRMQGLSAASISLGSRLKKSAGDWSRASSLRKPERSRF
ncbi:hypothetical protein EDB81DRAFT_707116 [Dactylonectria macrodidyma]|uniref:WDR59/RTC1-like RING zinc finger domain-containing protein n=1 Tax=Dactylonectria macrodidyma TaxID=307937 RepID=A0A9P9JNB8_9HYPO|nr:hypothetical protein EDB81DRAFT_707116 [Dactylonectria macrodidyma]